MRTLLLILKGGGVVVEWALLRLKSPGQLLVGLPVVRVVACSAARGSIKSA